jgi:hypothetical protein
MYFFSLGLAAARIMQALISFGRESVTHNGREQCIFFYGGAFDIGS